MFRVLLKMHIRPGLEDEFERVWLEVGDAITGHPANRGQWLLRSAEETAAMRQASPAPVAEQAVSGAAPAGMTSSDVSAMARAAAAPVRAPSAVPDATVARANLPGC